MMARYRGRLHELLRGPDSTRVCDLGAGASPGLTTEQIAALDLDYVVIDSSAEELAKAPDGYQKVTLDITQADPEDRPGGFDLIFTRWVCEHIEEPRAFHAAVFEMLRPGGAALHVFPTLWGTPAVANLALPEAISGRVLNRYAPRSKSKFPAYYRWCRGPSARSRDRFESVGFTCDEYRGFFGHRYLNGLGGLGPLSARLARRRLWRPRALTTTFALVLLRRPA